MMNAKYYLFLLFCNIGFSLFSQTYWSQTAGPEGGFVGDIYQCKNGDLILNSNGCGIYRSKDEGLSWEPLEFPFVPDRLLFADNAKNEYFAIDFFKGLFKSTDQGKNWTKIDLPDTITKYPSIFFIDIMDRIFLVSGTRAFYSEDSGSSFEMIWSLKYNKFEPHSVSVFGDSVFIISNNKKAAISIDKGLHWTNIFESSEIKFISFNQSNIIGVLKDSIILSRDFGTTWESQLIPDTLGYVGKVKLGVKEQLFINFLYNGLFKSSDFGLSWERLPYYDRDNTIDYHIDRKDEIFLSNFKNGFLKYDKFKQHWTTLNKGLRCSYVPHICVTNGDTLLTKTNAGLFKSINSGMDWSPLLINDSLIDYDSRFLSVFTGRVIFITSKYGNILKSEDHGNTWISISICPSKNKVYDLASTNNGSVYAATSCGLWETNDLGETWYKLEAFPEKASSIVYIDYKGRIYAGHASKLFLSEDHGSTWVDLNTPSGFEIGLENIIVDRNDDIFLIVSNLPLIRSSDRGKIWEPIPISGSFNQPSAFAILSNGDYLISHYNQILQSNDRGKTWIDKSSGFEKGPAICFSNTDQESIYGGSYHTGVFKNVIKLTSTLDDYTNKNKFSVYVSKDRMYLNFADQIVPIIQRLMIFNLDGKCVKTFTQKELDTKVMHNGLEINQLTSGIYTYQLYANSELISGKFAWIRN